MDYVDATIPVSKAREITKSYKYIRSLNPCHTFSLSECLQIHNSYKILDQYINTDHPLINFSPIHTFMDKGIVDEHALSLWNEIMDFDFQANDLIHLREQAVSFTNFLDLHKPLGIGFTEKETIQYITASSSSAFLGIQNAAQSEYALNSMLNTLVSHSSKVSINRPWLIPNLEEVHNHLMINRDIMARDYGELLLHAKASSSSIPNVSQDYRTFVSQNTFQDILDTCINYENNKVPYLMFAGIRNSNRAKYRLIFSMSAYFRILDYLINNGSYELCKNKGLYGSYTTEGLTISQMWDQFILMSDRDNVSMLCIDYKGYDTQISFNDYLKISLLLNKHRLSDLKFQRMFSWYYNWLFQPKPLVTRNQNNNRDVEYQWILDYQSKLASGLHGTHSFENLYGIATYKELLNQGINVKHCWFNGDDQNFLINKGDVDKAIDWLSSQFEISWEKSLINHSLSVWSKMWFSKDQHPMWEVGTFRSIFEREGGQVNLVEESKFQSNYCKIIQVAITLIRIGKRPEFIQRRIDDLCQSVKPKIDSSRIPMFLESLQTFQKSTTLNLPKAKGILDSKFYLMNKTFNVQLLNCDNYYDMLMSMYKNNLIYSLEPQEILYYPENFTLSIDRGINYSQDESDNIPWMYKNLNKQSSFTPEQNLVRGFLQGTKSYDGVSDNVYHFHNMLSLAYAINERNKHCWRLRV